LLWLQRTYGNRHVQRLAEQGRLRISRASDPAEREAGRVARAVAGAATPSRPEASSAAYPVSDIDGSTERAIRQARGSGQPLPGRVRGPMEQQLGADLDGVRLHTDARADQLSRSLQAQAFTTGSDIFFRRGGYAPGSAAGRHVLAHELAHVAQQQLGTGQPTVQRFIASVNHGLRDPKGKPKDDYGTYRSLDVALADGGGEVYTGPNTAEQGGRLDQLAGEARGIQLKEKENLYLVGHGSKNLIGVIGPEKVAKAVVNITPEKWEGQIFSLNCWSAYRVKDAPSALENLQQSLAKKGRNVSVSGPMGKSIRHRDWLGEQDSPLGMRAVVAELEKGDEESAYEDIMKSAREEAGIKTDPEDAFDAALTERFKEKVNSGTPIGVREKAKFATKWGRAFQASLVKKLETDERLKKAIDERRVLLGRSGLYESIVPVARELRPGEEKVISVGRAEEKVISADRSEEKVTSVARAEDSPRETARRPEDAGEGRSWSWLSIAGVGLVGLAALGAGLALIKLRRR
jgi:hypothetical protein